MIKWKNLKEMPCSKERAIELGYELWCKEIKLIKELNPSETELRSKFNELAGIKEEIDKPKKIKENG